MRLRRPNLLLPAILLAAVIGTLVPTPNVAGGGAAKMFLVIFLAVAIKATGDYILNGIGADEFVFDPYDPFDCVRTVQFDQRVTGKGGLADFHVHMTQQIHRDGTMDEPHYLITCEP